MIFPCSKNSHLGEDSAAEGASPLSGAISPHIVIRGETTNNPPTICHKYLANKISFIDYLSFSHTPKQPETSTFPLQDELIHLFNIPPEEWSIVQGGWYGYTHKAKLGPFGIVAWGGSSQRGTYHVELTGLGCHRIRDWLDVYAWGIKNNVKITRLDIAHDDLKGSIVNIKNARKWIDQGLFHSTGRPPNIRTIDDHDSGKGKTIYIGERKNGRLIRIYEKGKQLGDSTNNWCRAELETRSKDRVIGWDTVLNPDHYLSGSCKALSYLCEKQSKIKTLSKAKEITLEHAIKYCKITYGQLIHTLECVEGHDPKEIIKMLGREGIPEKLKHKYSFSGT